MKNPEARSGFLLALLPVVISVVIATRSVIIGTVIIGVRSGAIVTVIARPIPVTVGSIGADGASGERARQQAETDPRAPSASPVRLGRRCGGGGECGNHRDHDC